jgi:hypothetical protein
MAETIDFERVAREIFKVDIPVGDSVDEAIEQGIHHLAEHLRLVWNARGTADVARLDAFKLDNTEEGYWAILEAIEMVRALGR